MIEGINICRRLISLWCFGVSLCASYNHIVRQGFILKYAGTPRLNTTQGYLADVGVKNMKRDFSSSTHRERITLIILGKEVNDR